MKKSLLLALFGLSLVSGGLIYAQYEAAVVGRDGRYPQAQLTDLQGSAEPGQGLVARRFGPRPPKKIVMKDGGNAYADQLTANGNAEIN